jgi:hypothetical protein
MRNRLSPHSTPKQDDAGDERPQRKPLRVEERNDEYRADIIGNCQAEQEDVQGEGDSVPQQREEPNGKCDISCARNCPPALSRQPVVEQSEDERRNRHAANGSIDWQRRLPPRRELPLQQLLLDLQPDKEEEDRHQAVVDPEHQRLGQRQVPVADDEVGEEELLIACAPRAVCPQERDERAQQQQEPRHRRVLQALLQGFPKVVQHRLWTSVVLLQRR